MRQRDQSHVLILSEPSAGKSTLLRQLAERPFDYLSPNIIAYPEMPRPYPNWQTNWTAEKPAPVRELWVRALVPPSLRRPCYTSAANICRIADYVLDAMFFWSPDRKQYENQFYWALVGLAAFSALMGSAVAWFVTRPDKKIERRG